MNFTVIDTKTGEYPDLSDIALHEEWAQGLMYCDMEGFAILEDGTLILMDECGRFTYCPEGRFQIVPDEPNEPLACEGCIYEHNEHENCNYCTRAPYLGDYYHRRPPEGAGNA